MVANGNQDASPEEKIPLNPVDPENGQLNMALEQRRPHNEGPGRNEQNGSPLNRWTNIPMAYKIIFPALGLLNIAVTIAIIVLSLACKSRSCPSCPSCPEEWIMWKGKCYLFSDAEGTWNASQKNCCSHGASLFVPGPEKEMAFIRRFMEPTDYWIGLWREEERQPWKWPNGSVFESSLEIRANGPCAYLDKEKTRSTWCDTQRNWICTKSIV